MHNALLQGSTWPVHPVLAGSPQLRQMCQERLSKSEQRHALAVGPDAWEFRASDCNRIIEWPRVAHYRQTAHGIVSAGGQLRLQYAEPGPGRSASGWPRRKWGIPSCQL